MCIVVIYRHRKLTIALAVGLLGRVRRFVGRGLLGNRRSGLRTVIVQVGAHVGDHFDAVFGGVLGVFVKCVRDTDYKVPQTVGDRADHGDLFDRLADGRDDTGHGLAGSRDPFADRIHPANGCAEKDQRQATQRFQQFLRGRVRFRADLDYGVFALVDH